jgi:hypothetical protein
MKRENKVLLSLLPYNKEELKLEMLKDEASFKEIMRAMKYHRCENVDERIENINNYNTVFFGEKDYPKVLGNLKIPPMRIQSTSTFPDNEAYKIGLVSSKISLYEELNNFADLFLNVLRNNITIISIGCGGGSFVESWLKVTDARSYCLLSHGIDDFNSSSTNSIFLSTYEPNQKSNTSMRLSMYEVFGILCNAIIFFETTDKYEINNVINSILDCGGNLYLSRAGMNSNKSSSTSLRLLLEGCPIISNLCDIDGFTYDYLNHKVVYSTKQRSYLIKS